MSQVSTLVAAWAMQSTKNLVVAERARRLATAVYRHTESFPASERFGLTAQMRRAAVSIASNIAEGQARHTTGEFIQFISHAEGSTAELETQLILSVELGFSATGQTTNEFILLDDIRRMLNGLRRKLSAAS